MKKAIGYVLIITGLFIFSTREGYAFLWKKKAETEKVEEKKEVKKEEKKTEGVKVEQRKPIKDEKAIEQARILRQKKEEQLNNTTWDIELTLLPGQAKKKKDVLIFKDNRIYAEGFFKDGFSPSNYTLTIEEDGTASWETMQTSEKKGVIFWRGEVMPDMNSMRGVISWRYSEGKAEKTEDYSFVSITRRALER